VPADKKACLEFARRCLELHDRTSGLPERVQLLEMAQAWRALAETAERIYELVEEAKILGLIPPRSKMS
jgi:hypothetical protein